MSLWVAFPQQLVRTYNGNTRASKRLFSHDYCNRSSTNSRPEVWFWQDGMFRLYHLGEHGYEAIARSAIPELTPLDLGLLARCVLKGETSRLKAIQEFRGGIQSILSYSKSLNKNGERGIRTLGTAFRSVQQISNLPLSTTQPSLQTLKVHHTKFSLPDNPNLWKQIRIQAERRN